MKLPVNFLLYVCSAGLLAQAGMWFVYASPKLKGDDPKKFHDRGVDTASKLLAQGRGTASSGANWVYGASQQWWERFKNVNLTGKAPPPPPPKPEDVQATKPPPSPDKPLSQIIDLVSLTYDGASAGKGGDTHVMVRYKPEANVKPPEDVLRSLQAPVMSGPRPNDVTAGPGGRGGKRPTNPPAAKAAETAPAPMPMAASNQPEIVQVLKPGQSLWKDYEDIKLVEVSSDASLAWFVRVKPDAQPGTEPKREELFKSSMSMSQEVQKLIHDLQLSGIVTASRMPESSPTAPSASWKDVEETTREGDIWNIGRNDVASFDTDPGRERFLERINADSYQSRSDSSVRGVQVRNVDSQLGSAYGINAGDVLKSINDTPVRNKAEVLQTLRNQYNVGTRTFHTKWLTSTGQEVERIYQAPPGRNNN
jgi:hypothetical protein